MRTHTRKRPYLIQLLVTLGISLVVTLILLGGNTAVPFSPFGSVPMITHAAALQPTCASTLGTQSALCEQHNPVSEGCAQDAASTSDVFAYSQNTLLGEVDIRYSATCHTYWVRTIAYAHVIPPVQSVDAIISDGQHLTNPRVTDSHTVAVSHDQAVIAYTPMLFEPSVFPLTMTGVFHTEGPTPLVTIPLGLKR